MFRSHQTVPFDRGLCALELLQLVLQLVPFRVELCVFGITARNALLALPDLCLLVADALHILRRSCQVMDGTLELSLKKRGRPNDDC